MLRKVSLGLILALAACGSARVIQRTQAGGVIELQGDRGKAMEQANQEMAVALRPEQLHDRARGRRSDRHGHVQREDTNAGCDLAQRPLAPGRLDHARVSRARAPRPRGASTTSATARVVPPPMPARPPAVAPPQPPAAAAGPGLLSHTDRTRAPQGAFGRFGARLRLTVAVDPVHEQPRVVERRVADLIDAVHARTGARPRRGADRGRDRCTTARARRAARARALRPSVSANRRAPASRRSACGIASCDPRGRVAQRGARGLDGLGEPGIGRAAQQRLDLGGDRLERAALAERAQRVERQHVRRALPDRQHLRVGEDARQARCPRRSRRRRTPRSPRT